jgi:hypothetical protein
MQVSKYKLRVKGFAHFVENGFKQLVAFHVKLKLHETSSLISDQKKNQMGILIFKQEILVP